MTRTFAALSAGVCLTAMVTPASAQPRAYQIEAGSLKSALSDYVRQSGRQVLFRGDDMIGVRSDGVRGSMSADDALARILAGTGFRAQPGFAGAVAIVREQQRPAAKKVNASRPMSLAQSDTPDELLDSGPPPGEAAASQNAASGDIVVTGSLIRNPNLQRSSPVNVVSADQIQLKSSNTAEELLRDLPGLVPASGSAQNLGNAGASFVNLRGLGDNRNLILVDGARLAPAELQGRFDLNNIPLAMIERTDVLTGGASTTYGADAVSGVVNFVTRSRFTGLEATLSEQITEQGDGNVFRGDIIAGKRFGGGRGNIVLAAGYQKADPVYQGSRSFGVRQFDSITGLPSGSTVAVPSTFSLPGSGSQQITSGGALATIYAPYNFNPFNLYQTGFERYNLYGTSRYEISDAAEVYGRAIWSRNTVAIIIAPGGAFSTPVQIPLSNPYLPAGARNQFCAANAISASDCLAASTAMAGDPAYRTVSSVMSRRSVENGLRYLTAKTTFQDYQFGLRGAITSNISYDVFGAYGESENVVLQENFFRTSRIRQSMLATRDAAGNIVCQDPSNNCVAVNWFGPDGSITPAMNGFLTTDTTVTQRTALTQVNAKISGDLGWSFPWAANPVSFAVGGEYRRYKASQTVSAVLLAADTSGGGGLPNIRGVYDVWEAVGEVVAPIVQDRPLLQDLTLEAGVRYSRYSIDAPGSPSFQTTTWKVGGGWSPVRGAKLRGNYARAVRAPNIFELFEPRATGIGRLQDDPCANLTDRGAPVSGRPTPSGILRDVCIAQGAPASQIGVIQQPTAGQANVTTGGNLGLRPEESTSWTIGAVFTPAFLPRFSLTVDYYNIKVTGAISAPTTVDIVDGCFNSPSLTNPSCMLIRRDPLTGGLNGDQTVFPGITLARSNLGRLAADGIDVTATYQHDLGFARWMLIASGNWAGKSSFQASPASVDRDCVGIYSVGCTSLRPEFQWSVRNTISLHSRSDISLLWRHIDALRSPDRLFNGTISELGGSFDFNRIPSYDYFDLSFRQLVGSRYSLQLTVQNLFDKKPPIVGGTIGAGGFNSGNTFPSSYDTLGRRFAVTMKASF